MQHCLQNMLHRASATSQEISTLEGVTIDAISLEVGALRYAQILVPATALPD